MPFKNALVCNAGYILAAMIGQRYTLAELGRLIILAMLQILNWASYFFYVMSICHQFGGISRYVGLGGLNRIVPARVFHQLLPRIDH